MPSIHLYAELLLNIRTINIFATLSTKHTSQSKAELSADRSSLTFQHGNQQATIHLPGKAARPCPTQLVLPVNPSSEISLRLQPEISLLNRSSESENIAPWSAGVLTDRSRLSCRACGCTVVIPEAVHEWKNLPSEHWAEMMDFWHCHKPNEPPIHGAENYIMQKGYAASNHLTAQPGTVFVDLLYFLVSPQDCCSMKVGFTFADLSHRSQQSHPLISCFSFDHGQQERDPFRPQSILGRFSDTIARY